MKQLLSAVTATLLAIASTNIQGAQVSANQSKEFDLFPGTDTIPILSWYCITKGNITVENYQELKDCGFNLSFPETSDFESAKQALDCAAAVGIRTLFLCDELSKTPETIVPQVMNHPGLAGYHLLDEPSASNVPQLKIVNEKIKAIDSKHFTYLNLLPNHAKFKTMTYHQYIDYCSKEVDTSFISYDQYGIVDGKLRPCYFENLEIFSAYARSINKPFWAFALATAHSSYPIPNPAQLKFQMYCNLAYGAQGLQYFTYWNPGTKNRDYHEAPILLNGKRSSVYDFVREVNMELQKRNFVFMHSKVQFVRHTGKELPQGTTRLVQADLPKWVQKLDTYGKDAVVSLLRKGKTDYLVIVNGSFDDPMDLTITLAPNVIRIRKDGTSVRADEYEDNLIVLPGECEVFAWQN